MGDEREPDCLRALWHAQHDDGAAIDVNDLRMRAGKFQRRIFWRNAVEYIATAAVVAIFGAMTLDASLGTVQRVAAALCIAGALFAAWQLYRRASSRVASVDVLADSCAAFHRRELERQRDALASVWRWYLAPFVPGLLVFFVGVPIATGRGWGIGLACLAVASALYFAIAKANRAAARQLQDQIDALGELASR